jgi:hypothetical protein
MGDAGVGEAMGVLYQTRLPVFSWAEVKRGYIGGGYRRDDADTRKRFSFYTSVAG